MRKRSVHRRARTEFNTSAFAQFPAPLSADVLSQAAVSASAGPSGVADKGKAPMPDLDYSLLKFEYKPTVTESGAKELDELMMHMTETDWLNLMMQVGSNPALARELLGADVTEENFVERMTAIKDKKKRALADLRYRALKGKPMQQSEVNQMMRNLVKNQWCAAHNGTITMKAVKAMSKQRLIEEYEYICRRLEKDRLVDRDTSQPSGVPAASTHHADDPDSAGGGSFNPAGSATPMTGSAVPDTAGGTIGTTVTASTVPTSATMDSAGSHHELGILPFADSADSSSPDEDEQDRIFSGAVCGCDKLPDDEIVDPTGKDVDVGLDLWRDVNLLCQSLHSDDVEDFWRTQDEWVVSSWKLYPRSYCFKILDLTNGKRVYVVDMSILSAGSLLERIGYPKLDGYHFPYSLDEKWLVHSKRLMLASPEQTATEWKLLLRDVAASVDSAVHRVHAVSFDAAVASLVSAACVAAAAYFVPAALQSSCFEKIYLETWN
ncbi:hypothetical protein Tco_0819387 [Tanacetum coccineum]|uniref:PH domain-containing protein n=1 Tax=Tanacetum coccineum TaxID=301880 RepID=A0ABQ5AAN4_9ASTR